jgi:hypothetical protein
VVGGGGAELWEFIGSWSGAGGLLEFTQSPGTNSTLSYKTTLSSLGLALDDTFYFDAYSSGGAAGDSAIDSLANPNVSVTGWLDPYTSTTTGSGGAGLNSYKVVPEPTTLALLGLASAGYMIRHRARNLGP